MWSHYGYALTDCVGYSDHSGYSDEEVIIRNATGKYYVVVDGYNAWYNSGFKIKVECLYETGSTCEDADYLDCGDDYWVDAPTKNNFSGNDIFLGIVTHIITTMTAMNTSTNWTLVMV